jgi:FkbM family methyltransferase
LKQPWLFSVRTSTNPPFWLKVHTYNDDTISPIVAKTGCFECNIYGAFMDALYSLPSDDAFLLDIGANLGLYALGAAAGGYSAHAFEPLQRNWAPLCYSVMANPGFEDKIHLYKTALSSNPLPTKITFRLPWYTNPSSAQIVVPTKADGAERQDEGSDIALALAQRREGIDWAWAVSLEAMQHTLPTNITAVIKVDTEGHECQALAGAMTYLRNLPRIAYVAIEWSPIRLAKCENREAIFALLQKHHLLPFLFTPSVPRDGDSGTWIQVEYDNWHTDWRIAGEDKHKTFDIHFAKSKPTPEGTARRVHPIREENHHTQLPEGRIKKAVEPLALAQLVA